MEATPNRAGAHETHLMAPHRQTHVRRALPAAGVRLVRMGTAHRPGDQRAPQHRDAHNTQIPTRCPTAK